MARNKYPEETIQLILEEALKLFMEKGYDHTSIQDIINHLGGLSKGAIYYHFKSKEEIFEAVCEKIANENTLYFDGIRDDKTKTGLEKLRAMVRSSYENPNNKAIFAITDKIVQDSKFMMLQVTQIFELVVPRFVEPIIRQGIGDGTIQTEYPKELAEVILTLLNIWINPGIAKTTPEEMGRKLIFLDILLRGIGIEIIDDEVVTRCVEVYKGYPGS